MASALLVVLAVWLLVPFALPHSPIDSDPEGWDNDSDWLGY